MDSPLQQQWAKKSRFLTQALIFSGALNIGLLSSFFYLIIREKKEAFAFEMQPSGKKSEKISNADILTGFATMSYAELVSLLDNVEPIEEGYKKRDLALASLVMFHFVDLEKALQGFPLQKRSLTFQRKDGPEQIAITVYPGLGDDQFKAVHQFLARERFPFTTKGLFFELQQAKMPRDRLLLEAFCYTPEFASVMTLLTRVGVALPQEYVVELVSQGSWDLLEQFTTQQRQLQDLSPDCLKNLLLQFIRSRSVMAAKIFLEWDREFILKKFDDADLMVLIDLFGEKSESIEKLLKELITSPRSDAVWKKAGEKLFIMAGLPLPDPYDHQITLRMFTTGYPVASTPKKLPVLPKPKRVTHIVQPGENLWKIARKYKVSIEALKRANHLDTDKLRPGKELVITEDLPHHDSRDDSGRSAGS